MTKTAVNPLVLHTDLPNQVNISTSRGDFAVTFGSITQTQKLDPRALVTSESEPFNTGDINASNINVLASSGSLLVLHIDDYAGHAAYNRKAGADQTAFSCVETLKGLALSPLLTVFRPACSPGIAGRGGQMICRHSSARSKFE